MNQTDHQFIPYPRDGRPRVGVVFPQIEFTGDAAELRRFATSVEQMGYRHLLAYDHVLGAATATRPNWTGTYTSDNPFQEPFALFGFVAACAPGLELASGVLILPQRQTALVAKQAATVDFLSNGNLRLGVGIGWNRVEYEALNETFGNRGRRLEEQIDVIRQLTSHDVIDYTGRWHRIDRAGIRPLGVQRPIPIWIGGSAEKAIRRAARIADGYMPNGTALERVDQQLAIFRDELANQGRDERTVGIEARVSIAKDDPDAWKRDLAHWIEAGLTHISLVTMGGGLRGTDAHLERFEAAMHVAESL
ncbi:MAG TPA: LLM class F420-dependent oxidoreductase [Thermomicrobiales bacterium]|nr:LLM class F420-dependent oxidoreductase [Thermomicrobiales bacterium]